VDVAKHVGSRSADRGFLVSVDGRTELTANLECSKRWNQHLDPALVHSQWTQDEVRLLSLKSCNASSDIPHRSDSSFEQSPFTAATGALFSKCIFNAILQIASRISELLGFCQCLVDSMSHCLFRHAIVSRNYERLQAVLTSISNEPPCCPSAASSSQSTPLLPGRMLPLSDTSPSTSQSVPWTPTLSDPVGDYGMTTDGTPSSEYYSSHSDALCKFIFICAKGTTEPV
jgi:hypothetical protein